MARGARFQQSFLVLPRIKQLMNSALALIAITGLHSSVLYSHRCTWFG
jgi:hypothetical protein